MIITKKIEQSVQFEGASPHEVYELLMDANKFASLSGKKSEISRNIGGAVITYEGFAKAINIELIPDVKIVQAWKGGISQWPKDHYSIVVYEFEPQAKGTRLQFTHIGVPDAGYSIIDAGWPNAYWEPMKKALAAR